MQLVTNFMSVRMCVALMIATGVVVSFVHFPPDAFLRAGEILPATLLLLVPALVIGATPAGVYLWLILHGSDKHTPATSVRGCVAMLAWQLLVGSLSYLIQSIFLSDAQVVPLVSARVAFFLPPMFLAVLVMVFVAGLVGGRSQPRA